jgi:hypothetical protein
MIVRKIESTQAKFSEDIFKFMVNFDIPFGGASRKFVLIGKFVIELFIFIRNKFR